MNLAKLMDAQRRRLDQIRGLAHDAITQVLDKRLTGQDAIVTRPHPGTDSFGNRLRGQVGQG